MGWVVYSSFFALYFLLSFLVSFVSKMLGRWLVGVRSSQVGKGEICLLVMTSMLRSRRWRRRTKSPKEWLWEIE